MEEIFHPVSSYIVTSDYDGVRLDNCLISRLKGLPRTKVYSIIRKGEVRVNKSRSKPSLKLKKGDIIRIPPYKSSSLKASYTSKRDKDRVIQSIITEEKDFIIFNKPAGMACHGGSGISSGLIEIIRKIDSKYEGAHLVHRIDKETSGLLVIAKTEFAMTSLAKQFYLKTSKRKYLALVWGIIPDEKGTINKRLARDPKNRLIMSVPVDEDGYGKEAITHYTVSYTHLRAHET